jgi:sec-independent protein translocase protein TatB
MFDIGWSELLIIAVVAIIVIGPKDLPRVLRNLGRAMGAVRRTASEFKAQFEDAVRDSELEELQREFADVAAMNPAGAIENAIGASLEPVSPAETKPKKARKTAAKTKSASKRRRKTTAKPATKTAQRSITRSSAKKPKAK